MEGLGKLEAQRVKAQNKHKAPKNPLMEGRDSFGIFLGCDSLSFKGGSFLPRSGQKIPCCTRSF
jgi:hypothetical protein